MSMVMRMQVMEYEQGLLYEKGRCVKTLGPGRYWVLTILGQKLVKVDARLVSLTVPNQEVLTKDRLPIRLTLIAQYRVKDAAAAVNKAQNYLTLLYEELQLAMRALAAEETLEGLLASKKALAETLAGVVRPRMAEYGVELAACGLKDVTLPGDVKAMMAKTVEAEKAAQAALITAREELAATRCQVNTAKLIADNPVILRLKELQALTELAKKPGNNTIVLGQALLEGVRKP